MYGIEVGDIFVAADGGQHGHLVTDITTFEHCGDVITTPFTSKGFYQGGNRICAFKLAKVRYYQPDVIPDWVPT